VSEPAHRKTAVGRGGYDDFLATITNRKHPRHQEIREWIGEFDPEAFVPKMATKEMRKVK
jgi:Plasmid pRiA4b ORF-3-like protein